MNYDQLRLKIQNSIKGNASREITGFLLQDVLLSIVDILGADIISNSNTTGKAADSALLEGHPASYFATAKSVSSLEEKDTIIEEKITKIKEITDHFFIDEHGLGTHKNFRSTGTVASGGAAQAGQGGGSSGGTTGEYKMYVHTQGDPLKVWTIQHMLNKVPNVKIIDSTGEQVYGSVKVENMNEVTVSFGGAFSGIAYLD